jgi:hypothetical protein
MLIVLVFMLPLAAAAIVNLAACNARGRKW